MRPLKISRIFQIFICLLVGLSILRIAFVWQNAAYFKTLSVSLYFYGVYFDLITLALLGLPMFLFYNPLISKFKRTWHGFFLWIAKLYLILLSLFVLVLNSWDIAYYSYTQKRSSFSYFVHMLTGTETSSLAGEFLAEFWWLPLLFLLLFIPICRLILLLRNFASEHQVSKQIWLRLFLLFCLVVVLGRGGLQLRPIGIIDATAMSSLEQAPIVLNTAFTVLKTSDADQTKMLNIHSEVALRQLLPNHTQSSKHSTLPKATNVVFLILESFGSNYVGPSAPRSFTPFLDSLFDNSLFFEFAIANGRTSMDAVPAILAGMPSWLPESYILSPYCGNQLNSLPQILKQKGYTTSFYHGAKEGSMNFQSFTKAIDIDSYKGLESYPDQAHFDGNWGVWDHNMLPYFGRELARQKQPFFSTLFTLSSHHPYEIPKQFQSKVKLGPEPLCRSISYTDLALKDFFQRFKNEDWFKNTLFVLTADHVGPTRQKQFQTLDWRYRIPIAFYHPSREVPKPARGVVFQQIDILPTVLDMLGLAKPKFQLGSSCFEVVQGQKMAYDNGNLLSFIYNGTNLVPIAWTPGVKRSYTPSQQRISAQTSALYQYYMNSLLQNRCSNRTLR